MQDIQLLVADSCQERDDIVLSCQTDDECHLCERLLVSVPGRGNSQCDPSDWQRRTS